MNPCRCVAIVVAVFSLFAMALGLWGGSAAFSLHPTWLRLGTGLGTGGLFFAFLLWLWPERIRDSAPRALSRRYYREFFPPMFGYVAVMMFWAWLLKHVDATWLRVLVALLPAVMVLLMLRAIMRYVRDSDEMQRRIELESIAIAAGLVGAVYMTAGFLQSAKVIAVPATSAMLWVFPALCMFYGVVKLFTMKRYQ